ncbi:MAG: cytochrome P450, partial [Cystobacter sp.]
MRSPAVQWSPEHLLNPYPFYAALREAAPVIQVEAFKGAHTVTRYDDITTVLREPVLYSSRRVVPDVSLTAESGARAREYFRSTNNLISSDPPAHTRLRALVSQAFTSRRIAGLEPWLKTLAHGLIDRMLEREEFDVMAELAIPLPVTVISELLGVEPERREDFKRWSDHIVQTMAMSVGPRDPAPILASLQEFQDYLEQAIARRGHERREDLLGALIDAGQGILEVEDLISFARLLLVAGNETTTHLLGNTLVALLRHPEQLTRLLEDPSLTSAVIEEALRYDPPVQMLARTASAATRLAGHAIPEGARVMLLIAGANRDPRRFEEPDRFDLARAHANPLSFGHGAHFCIGAALARLETKVVLEALVSRVRHLAFAPGQQEAIHWG